jgi:hypothetical protein
VEVGRAAVEELLDELGDLGPRSPVGRELANLLLGGNLASQEQPEETFRQGLLAAGGLGKELLALGDGLATEANALLGVEDGTLPHQALDATGAAIYLVEGDLVDDLGAVLPDLVTSRQQHRTVQISSRKGAVLLPQSLDLLDLLGQKLSEALLQGLQQSYTVNG